MLGCTFIFSPTTPLSWLAYHPKSFTSSGKGLLLEEPVHPIMGQVDTLGISLLQTSVWAWENEPAPLSFQNEPPCTLWGPSNGPQSEQQLHSYTERGRLQLPLHRVGAPSPALNEGNHNLSLTSSGAASCSDISIDSMQEKHSQLVFPTDKQTLDLNPKFWR